MMSEEESLIEGCKKRDRVAQGKLYQKYASRMKGVCLRYGKNEDEAKDILQEAFIKIFSNIGTFTFKHTGSLEGWVKRIIINTAISYFKKHKKLNQPFSLDEYPDIVNDSALNEDDEDIDTDLEVTQEELLHALQELPELFRIVFNLFYMENYSHKEIAESLSIDEKTSRTRLFRAKELLRKKLLELSAKIIK